MIINYPNQVSPPHPFDYQNMVNICHVWESKQGLQLWRRTFTSSVRKLIRMHNSSFQSSANTDDIFRALKLQSLLIFQTTLTPRLRKHTILSVLSPWRGSAALGFGFCGGVNSGVLGCRGPAGLLTIGGASLK